MPSRKSGLIGVSVASALALSLVACHHDSNAQDDRIQEVARKEGADPGLAISLEKANKEFYENRPTEKLFSEVVAATKYPNENTRSEAYTTLATLRGTNFHDLAIAEIDRMKNDESPKVRDRYVWVSYLAEHPNWIQIENEVQRCGSEEAKRLGKLAEGYGPRQPKRETYGKS